MSRNRIWHRVSIAIAALATVFFVGYAVEHLEGLPPLRWDASQLALMGVSTLLWSAMIGVGAVIWHGLLADMGHPLSWRECLVTYSLSQFGKYLPGNVAHHVGRVVMAREAGIPATVTLQSMLVEMAWALSVAAGIALLGMGFVFSEDSAEFAGPMKVFTLTAVLVCSIMLPSTLLRILNALFPKPIARLTGRSSLPLPGLTGMLVASSLFLVSFLSVGFLLDLHARYLFGAPPDVRVLTLTTIYAWAWMAGYLMPGAPAGLGVREAVLVGMLAPIYGPGIAVGLSVSLRVATTLGDGLAFVLGLVARRLIRQHSHIGGRETTAK